MGGSSQSLQRRIRYGLHRVIYEAQSLSSRVAVSMVQLGSWVGLVMLCVAILLLFWNQLVRFDHKGRQGGGVLLLASYPRYLPIEDEGGVVVTVVNEEQHPITNTVVLLVYRTDYVSMDIGGTNRVPFGRLEPGERKTRLVKFQVNDISPLAQRVRIDLNLTAQDIVSNTVVTTTLPVDLTVIKVIPIGVSSLVMNRAVTIPNLLAALGSLVMFVFTLRKLVQEARSPGTKEETSDSGLALLPDSHSGKVR